jgi:outer membrane protein assembly factor BamB
MRNIQLGFIALLFSLFFSGCFKESHVLEKYVIWKGEIAGGDVYDCIFSINDDKAMFITSSGITCYDLKTGKPVWKNKIHSLRTPLFLNKMLTTGHMNRQGLYCVDIVNGKTEKMFDIKNEIYKVEIEKESTFILITDAGKQSRVQRFNIISGETENLLTIDGVVKNQLKYYNGNIVLTSGHDNMTYLLLIDGGDRKIKRKDVIAEWTLFKDEFVCMGNCVFYIKDIDGKTKLLQIDIETGNVLGDFPIDFSVGYLREDGKSILISGESLCLFDSNDKIFISIADNASYIGHGATINNGRVVFSDKNTIYYYSIAGGTTKAIYDLQGQQLFNTFMHKDNVIIILSDNIRESVLDGKPFTVVALTIPGE